MLSAAILFAVPLACNDTNGDVEGAPDLDGDGAVEVHAKPGSGGGGTAGSAVSAAAGQGSGGNSSQSAGTGGGSSDSGGSSSRGPIVPDMNGDGTLDILVLGTSQSIEPSASAFSGDEIARELQQILQQDPAISGSVHVASEDIYRTKIVSTGAGQGGPAQDFAYRSHSLAQYYYWPDGRDERMKNLSGTATTDWDIVVIAADPYLIATLPGFYSLGVNKIASKVAEGNGQPVLLMPWSSSDSSIDEIAESSYRVADGAKVFLPVVPAALAWKGLPAGKKDTAAAHPTPSGAFLAAAAIYSRIYGRSAGSSDYELDDELADAALSTIVAESTRQHYAGQVTDASPFVGAEISDRILHFNHTGSSSEAGILSGLKWVCARANVPLLSGGDPPVNFNYGRANTDFEPDKRYQVDPARFEASLGFPMQDNALTGNTSMLYGLDWRRDDGENGTDLGVARHMVNEGELPYARAIPVRTLYAQLKEASPSFSAFQDSWHMSAGLNKAIGAYMFTLLTGHCALDEEPADTSTVQWSDWAAHKIGYETAWGVMHLAGSAPGFKVRPSSAASVSVNGSTPAELFVSFVNRPSANVTVELSSTDDAALAYSPSGLTFTPDNYGIPQKVTLTALAGASAEQPVTLSAKTQSSDHVFDALTDRWTYEVSP